MRKVQIEIKYKALYCKTFNPASKERDDLAISFNGECNEIL